MKGSFTLIEIIVAIVIISLISGGALLYLNRFNSQQGLEKAREEMIVSIKLVQSYAKGRQLPLGSTVNELKYIRLAFSSGLMTAYVNEIGTSYFSKIVGDSGTSVTYSRSPIIFWAGTGRLASDINGTAYNVGGTETITIEQTIESVGRYLIRINALGQISEVKHEN